MESATILRTNLLLTAALRRQSLFELLKPSGLSVSTITRINHETVNISLELIDKIAFCLHIPAHLLISPQLTEMLKRADKEMPPYLKFHTAAGAEKLKPFTALLNDIQIYKVQEWEKNNLTDLGQ